MSRERKKIGEDRVALDAYLRLRAQGCGYHLSDASWHCRADRDAYPGTDEPCQHVQDAIPNWRDYL